MAGPLVVVIASLASAWMAMKSDDGIVAADYYKQGLSINLRRTRAAPEPVRPDGATITLTERGEVRVRLEGRGDIPGSPRLKLARPSDPAHDETVILKPGANGDYVGTFAGQMAGRWIVTLESGAWRLPTTTVSGLRAEIRLGTADRN